MSLYQPLDKSKNQIRLLYFVDDGTVPETRDGMIRLEMKTVSLHDGAPEINFSRTIDSSTHQWDAPTQEARWKWGEYLTLSYTWGSHHNPHTILVNDHPLKITQNLESFLRSFRNSYLHRIDKKRTGLWIDAICLNQKDTVEKSVHIKSMKDIYSRALTTAAWLGPETPGTVQAMEYINLASGAHFECLNTSTAENRKCEFITEARENCLESGLIKALQELVTRPYWTRLWVMQELALSGPNMKILCGNTHTKWKSFYRGILRVFNGDGQVWHKATEEDGVDVDRFQAALNRLGRLSSLARRLEDRDLDSRGTTGFLADLFRVMRSSEQHDLRDKVYGVTSLLDPKLAELITPDYELPVEQVFLDFAKALVSWSGGLDVVVEQGRFLEGEGGNSWVPRWGRFESSHPNPMGAVKSFRACGEMETDVRFEGRKLVTRGFLVDTIPEQWSSSSTTSSSEDGTAIGESNPYGDENATREAVWRTLIADSDLDKGKRAPVSYEKLLDFPLDIPDPGKLDHYTGAYMGAFYDMRKEYLDFPLWGKKFGEYFPETAGHSEEPVAEKGGLGPSKDKEDFDPFYQCRFMMSTRKLVVTSKGYLGLVRMEVNKGDMVAILFGCQTPVVLRRRNSADGVNGKQEYDLIGQAYVHGLMDGEGLRMLERRDCVLEELVVC